MESVHVAGAWDALQMAFDRCDVGSACDKWMDG